MPTSAESMKAHGLVVVDESLTISSTRLSENATSNFPSVGCIFADKSSQAKFARPDNGIIAKKLRIKTASGIQGVAAATSATGRKTSNKFR